MSPFRNPHTSRSHPPAEGEAAPDFRLPDQDGQPRSLQEFRGRWVVLYFYPRDNTPGCTREACSLRDAGGPLQELGAHVLGVSMDPPERHAAFAGRHGLSFPLLSDPDGEVSAAYGALFALGPIRFPKRRTFLIDPEGRVARVYHRVKPSGHGDELVSALRELQARRA